MILCFGYGKNWIRNHVVIDSSDARRELEKSVLHAQRNPFNKFFSFHFFVCMHVLFVCLLCILSAKGHSF